MVVPRLPEPSAKGPTVFTENAPPTKPAEASALTATTVSGARSGRIVTAESETYDAELAEARETDTLAPDVPGVHRPTVGTAAAAPATVIHVVDATSGQESLVQPPPAATGHPHEAAPSKVAAAVPWWQRARAAASSITSKRG